MTLTRLTGFPRLYSTRLSSKATGGTSIVRSSLICTSSASNTWDGSNTYFLNYDTWNTRWRFANWRGKATHKPPAQSSSRSGKGKELRRKLPWAESPSHTSDSAHPQEYMISSRKFQRSPPAVCIRLLPILRNMHPIPYHSHFLSSLLQQLWPNKQCFPILVPT